MQPTLSRFIQALRAADVRVSPAETLDALQVASLVGYADRQLLKNSLSLTLSKTAQEKRIFDLQFERFFAAPEESSLSKPRSSIAEAANSGQSVGIGGSGGGDAGTFADAQSELGQLLMQDSLSEIAMAIAANAQRAKVHEISVFTQKNLYARKVLDAMGLAGLQSEIDALRANGDEAQQNLAGELARRRDRLREKIRDYVERQFLLYADANDRHVLEDLYYKVRLSNVEQRNHRLIQELVFRMAKKLVALHARRKKVFKRGKLHVPRTLRHNMSYDGAIFDLRWKSVKIDRPKVFAVCDVSNSVSAYARFMLTFLYSLDEVMPQIRSFAFSSDLAEVSDLFEHHALEDAINKTLHVYGGGSTSYGQALLDFKRLCLSDIDNRTTVIVLGDARNNYGDAQMQVLKEIYLRCKRLIWLNPESRGSWGSGDSEMRRYSVYCHQVEECNSLQHLERVVNRLLRINH